MEVCEQQGDDAVDQVTCLREHTCIGKESELLISLIGLVDLYYGDFERSRFKSSPLEQTRSKLANPVEVTGFDRG